MNVFFNPKSVALIGASSEEGSVGVGVARNLLRGKDQRKVFFINPYQEKVLDKKCFDSIKDIPAKELPSSREGQESSQKRVDLVIVAVPAKIVPQVVKECAEEKSSPSSPNIGGIVVISAGFAERGKKGKALQRKVLKIANSANIPLLGPNALGVIRPSLRLNASFAPSISQAGNIAFISQSGALMDSIIDRTKQENYGFSTLISYGNAADIGICDLLSWLEKDEKTKVIIIYLEGLKKGREFMKIAKRVAKKKPIIVLKAGKGKRGREAISSHTGSLAGSYQIYSAAFSQSGVIEARSLEEMFDMAKALAWQPTCKNKIAILTNGGGCGVLCADACQEYGIQLSSLSDSAIKKMENSEEMHPAFSRSNPLDIVGDALPDRYKLALETLLSEEEVYGVIVIQTLQVMTKSKKDAEVIVNLNSKYPDKPIVCSFMGGDETKAGVDLLEKSEVPNYPTPRRAAAAMRALIKTNNKSS